MGESSRNASELKSEFIRLRGYWNPAWENVLEMTPDYFATYLDMCAVTSPPYGSFTCAVTLQAVRSPEIVRREDGGVTYLIARNYELAYETVLHFASGVELPIKASLIGELNQQIVIRDMHGKPVRISGYVQGRSQISDSEGNVIFEGRYYDARVTQDLAGDDALTPIGPRIIEHWENGFGKGVFEGHAFSLGVQLTREGDARPSGRGAGQID